jgi:hypothetical protein
MKHDHSNTLWYGKKEYSKESVGIDIDEVWYYKYIAATQEPLSDDNVRRYVAKWLFSNTAFDVVHIKLAFDLHVVMSLHTADYVMSVPADFSFSLKRNRKA